MVHLQEPMIQFNSIKVNAMQTNSGIFIGKNYQSNWSLTSNMKAGFGSISGHQNTVARNINIVNDDDVVDKTNDTDF